MASSKSISTFSPQKHLQAQPFPEEKGKNLVHTKPELVIEPEEMDFGTLRTSKCGTSKR